MVKLSFPKKIRFEKPVDLAKKLKNQNRKYLKILICLMKNWELRQIYVKSIKQFEKQ